MVGETTLNLLGGSTPEPPNGVAKDVGELTHDIMALAEFSSSCSEATAAIFHNHRLRNLTWPH